MLLLAAGLTAQEKYNVILERAGQMTPYEAIYMLMDYQQDKPEHANVYYQLGNRCYDLQNGRDALHSYRELNELLYRSKLFYGNCLHFAKDQKLPGWQYAEIANGEKKIDYAALEAFIRPRLSEVARRQTACDSIHRSLYRLVEQYNSCQALYSRFLTQYTREKTAHLELTATQRTELEQLARESSALRELIDAYQGALSLDPINGYNPSFHWQTIELYRLDGLTSSDFMKNDIALWDYSSWVSGFLREQKDVYERLYRDVDSEYEKLTLEVKRYRVGARVKDKTDEAIVGRCNRLELTSDKAQELSGMQTIVRLGAIEQQLAETKSAKSIRELIPLLQMAKSGQTTMENGQWTSNEMKSVADSAMTLIRTHLSRLAEPLAATQQATHISPINGETTTYPAAYGEHVHALLNTTDGWRCVVVDDLTNSTRVLDLSYEMAVRTTMLQITNEHPLVFAEMPESGWMLVTDKNYYFLKAQRD